MYLVVIQRGQDVTIGIFSEYHDSLQHLTEKYSDVALVDISGTQYGTKLGLVYGRTSECQFLCEMAAGAVSKSGNIWFVAAHPLGVVSWKIDAYALGAQSGNRKAVVNSAVTEFLGRYYE